VATTASDAGAAGSTAGAGAASTGEAVRLERGVLAAVLRRAGADAVEASMSVSVVRFLVMLIYFGTP
jgi:hypothetical protein